MSAWTICFTSEQIVRQVRVVRCVVAVSFSFLLVSEILAQDQERSLIDRLLRPDMELQNHAQGKKFAANSAVIENRGTVGTFFLPPRKEKQVADLRSLVTTAYESGSFENRPWRNSSAQNRDANLPGQLTTSSVRDIHEMHDANLKFADRSFAGERSFLDEGKSQKSLDRKNPPLTIDQVRELLNKNK